MSVHSLFSIVAVAFVLSAMVAGADATKAGKNARKLKGTKGTREPKSSKSSKGGEVTCDTTNNPCGAYGNCCAGCYISISVCTNSRRLGGDLGQNLQHMTDRFSEDGSVRSFVDSLGYKVDLHPVPGEKENVLAKEDCEGLMSLIDHGSYSNVNEPAEQNVDKYIDESDLVSVIGKVRIDSMPCGLCHPLSRRSKTSDLLLNFLLCVFYKRVTRTSSTPCLIFTKKLLGLPFLS